MYVSKFTSTFNPSACDPQLVMASWELFAEIQMTTSNVGIVANETHCEPPDCLNRGYDTNSKENHQPDDDLLYNYHQDQLEARGQITFDTLVVQYIGVPEENHLGDAKNLVKAQSYARMIIAKREMQRRPESAAALRRFGRNVAQRQFESFTWLTLPMMETIVASES